MIDSALFPVKCNTAMNTLQTQPAGQGQDSSFCPCGSGRAFSACCGGPLLRPSELQRKDPAVQQALKAAQADMRAGRMQQAETLVRRILDTMPGHLGALSLLARLRKQSGVRRRRFARCGRSRLRRAG